ncbi:hypothetical protein [Streptomyces sp. NPDC054961]
MALATPHPPAGLDADAAVKARLAVSVLVGPEGPALETGDRT